jgi:hypothetical protein
MVHLMSASKSISCPNSHTSAPGRLNSFAKTIQRCFCGYLGSASSLAPGKNFEEEEEEESKQHLESSICPIVASFIEHLVPGYKPSVDHDNAPLWSSSLAKASSMGIDCSKNSGNWKRLEVGFSYAHVCNYSHDHNLVKNKAKIVIALLPNSSPRYSNIYSRIYPIRANP